MGSCSPESAFVLAEKVGVLLDMLGLNTERLGRITVQHPLEDLL